MFIAVSSYSKFAADLSFCLFMFLRFWSWPPDFGLICTTGINKPVIADVLEFQVDCQVGQSHRPKVRVTGPDFRILQHCTIGNKKFVDMITHEPLHLAS